MEKHFGEKAQAAEGQVALISQSAKGAEIMDAHGVYTAQCYGVADEHLPRYQWLFEQINKIKAGGLLGRIIGAFKLKQYEDEFNSYPLELKWADSFDNIVTYAGKNFAFSTLFTGSAYTAAVFMGLKTTGTAVVGDTQASHAGWLEVGGANAPAYSGTRKTPAFSAPASGSITTSTAVSFTFTSSGTVTGCFLNLGGTSAQDNTTGTLFSAGDFTGGSQSVIATNVLNVTYTCSM